MDLDQMIKEGEEKHVKNKELAQQQVLKMQAEDNFDFKLDGVDMFQFQDKDFREEKKKIQALLLAEQEE